MADDDAPPPPPPDPTPPPPPPSIPQGESEVFFKSEPRPTPREPDSHETRD